MLKHLFLKDGTIAVAIAAVGSVALTGCVDDSYDLSKDMDMNVTVGGNLYLPASSTGLLTMGNVLDLGSDSSIKAISQDDINNGTNYGLALGDYVLVQTADPTETSVKVDQVTLTDVECTSTAFPLDFPIVMEGEVTLDTDFESSMNVPDQSVDVSIKRLDNAVTDLDLHVVVDYASEDYTGNFVVKAGYLVTFNDAWTIDIPTTSAAYSFATIEDGHKLRFTKDVQFADGDPFTLDIKVVNINFRNMPDGEGLYEPGKFKLDSKIHFEGDVSIHSTSTILSSVHVDMLTSTTIPTAKLLAVTGVVDPDIDIKDTRVEINDIPDFLSDENNNLDIANPQIYFTVTNTSPVNVDILATLSATYSDGSDPVVIPIGAQTDGTEAITINANSVTRICLSRQGTADVAGVQNIKVERLGQLLAKIPDVITITDIEANVQQEPITFVLSDPDDENDKGYQFNADYEAVVPLSFGENMKLVYSDTEDGWDEDLDDYNFNEVVVTLDVVNYIPLSLKPEAYLVGEGNKEFKDVVVTIEGEVAAGSVASPATSHLSISIKSVGENLSGVKGIDYTFTAKSGQNTSGVILNEQQGLKFDNIKIAIKGGVTVDLNNLDD